MTTSNIRLTNVIAPSFYQLHKAIKNHNYTHFDINGGRGSTKSSCISIEVILLIKCNPNINALVMRKVGNTLRTSVYEQYQWAISILGLDNEFICHVSPMEIIYKPTGQKILFFGCDDKGKIKSLKLKKGYIAITHFEEKDQFAGREEIRNILQSTMRGGETFWNFETYNPPISVSNWANIDSLEERPDRLTHKSCYLDVPREWLGEQFFFEAETLKAQNERAYRHEYLGEATGTGGNVFENLVIREITNEEISHFDHILNGIDWGWNPDPTTFMRVNYEPSTLKLYIWLEDVATKRRNTELSEQLKKHNVKSTELITCDNSSGESIADLRAYGWAARAAIKGPGSREYSYKWLQSLNEIIIDRKRCPIAAKEFEHYEYERGKDNIIISGYPDGDDHCIDGVRYATEQYWKRRGK